MEDFILSDKAKVDFEKWIIKNSNWKATDGLIKVFNQKDIYVSFNGISSVRIYFLILEWFDELSIYVNAHKKENSFVSIVNNVELQVFKHRKKAIENAISVASDFYNSSEIDFDRFGKEYLTLI